MDKQPALKTTLWEILLDAHCPVCGEPMALCLERPECTFIGQTNCGGLEVRAGRSTTMVKEYDGQTT